MPLRRRLTIVFVLAVGVSAAALAAGSYFVVRHNLLADSVRDDVRQARRNLVVAPAYLPQGSTKLIEAYRETGAMKDPKSHLTCYEIVDVNGPAFAARSISLESALSAETLYVKRPRTLCVPSTIAHA